MNQEQANQPTQQQGPLPQPSPKYRFRWGILAVPLTIAAFLWLRGGVEPSFQFEDVLDYLHLYDEQRYVRLACLGVGLIAALLIIKSLRNKRT